MRHRQVYTASFFLAAAVSRPFNDLPFIPPFYLLDASLHNSILASALSDYFAQQLSQHDLKFTLWFRRVQRGSINWLIQNYVYKC